MIYPSVYLLPPPPIEIFLKRIFQELLTHKKFWTIQKIVWKNVEKCWILLKNVEFVEKWCKGFENHKILEWCKGKNWKTLKNEALVAKIGVDTADTEFTIDLSIDMIKIITTKPNLASTT